jgi:hypothetical protein
VSRQPGGAVHVTDIEHVTDIVDHGSVTDVCIPYSMYYTSEVRTGRILYYSEAPRVRVFTF